MATVSFGRVIEVNPDWGLKNLEDAVEHPLDLNKTGKTKFRKLSKADMHKITKRYISEDN